MPMDRVANVALRDRGWNVFRSASRDHVVPQVSPGRVLQRIRIAQALPAAGTVEGVAVPLEVRERVATERRESVSRLRGMEDQPLGVMQYFSALLHNQAAGAVNGVALDESFVIGIAPFDGWLREVVMDPNAGDFGGFRVAVRTSSGGTFFRGFDQSGLGAFFEFIGPDFIPTDARGTGQYKVEVRGGKVPVFAGDQIIAVVRNTNGKAANAARIQLLVGVEAVILGSAGSRAAASQFAAAFEASRIANREAAANAGRLAIEQERTRRAELEAQARLELARLAQVRQRVESRETVPPPPRPLEAAPTAGVDGAGKTFVSAWLPNANSIGYLIPDPPRGGKVNVFNDTYSVFDVTGKLVDQGKVELVRSTDQIPPDARVSRNLGARPSGAIRQEQQAILATRAGASAFG